MEPQAASPKFKITAPDGGVFMVTAPDEAAALEAFQAMQQGAPVADVPTASGFANSYASQAATGFNEGLAGLLAAPGDLGNFASRNLGFGEPFYGSRDLVDDMAGAGMISPPSDDASKRITRRAGAVAGESVVPAAGMLKRGATVAAQAPAVTNAARGTFGGTVDDAARAAASSPGRFMAGEAAASAGAGTLGGVVAENTDNPLLIAGAEVLGGAAGGNLAVPSARASGPQARADTILTDRLAQDGMTPHDLAAAADPGSGARTVDVAGENTQRLAGAAKRALGPGKARLEASSQAVADGERAAMIGDANEALGANGADYLAQIKTVEARRAAEAKPRYNRAYDVEVDLSPEALALLQRPTMREAVREATRRAADDGVDFYDENMLRGLDAPGDGVALSDDLDRAETVREVGAFFDRYKEVRRSMAALSKRPASQSLKALGGIEPASPLGRELRARGITPKSSPGLFRKGGLRALDNLPASEHPDLADLYGSRGGDGYIEQDDWIDALEREAKGDPVRGSDEAALSREFDMLDREYDEYSRLRDDLGPEFERPKPAKAITMRGLDLIVRRLGARIDREKARAGADGDEIRRLTSLREGLLREIDAKNPDYAAARKVFSDDSALLGAFANGRKFARADADELADVFDTMNAAQKDAFRLGVARQLRDMTGTIGGRSQLMKDEVLRERLASIMPKAKVGKFLARIALRKQQRKANNAIRGGSSTAENLAEDAALTGDAVDKVDAVAAQVASGQRLSVSVMGAVSEYIKAGWQRGVRDARGKVADATSRRLVDAPETTARALENRMIENATGRRRRNASADAGRMVNALRGLNTSDDLEAAR